MKATLTKVLREAGYDYIDSPIRNHSVLQIWKKSPNEKVEKYEDNISDIFTSDVKIDINKSTALAAQSSKKTKFQFNLGLSVLDDILTSMDLGKLDLNNEVKTGKTISISYDNASAKEAEIGDIERYLSYCDIVKPFPSLLKDLNRKNIILITGVLYGILNVTVESNSNIKTDAIVNVKKIVEGKLDISSNSEKEFQMKSKKEVPIAVKAHWIDFDRGSYDDLRQLTNKRSFF